MVSSAEAQAARAQPYWILISSACGIGGPQGEGDVVRDLCAGDGDDRGVPDRAASEESDIRGAATDVDQADPEVLFVLHQYRLARGELLEHDVLHVEAAAVHALDDVLRSARRASDDVHLGLQPDARHADRLPDSVLVVDDELLREDVKDVLVGRDRNRPRGVDHPVDVAGADLAVPDRHDALRVEAANVAPGHPDVDRPDGLPGHHLGLLHRVPDGLHGVFDVDHHAPLEPAREVGSDPQELDFARFRGCAHQRHHLRGADVEPRDEALLRSRSHPCTLECASPPSRHRTAKPFG